MNHQLKTHRAPFEATWQGAKLFEFRRDDRTPRFAVGDTLILVEWNEVDDRQLYRRMDATVTYVSRSPKFRLPDGYVILGIRVDQRVDGWPNRPVRDVPGELANA